MTTNLFANACRTVGARKGFFVAEREQNDAVNGGQRYSREARSAATGELFLESEVWAELLHSLLRVPSIRGRAHAPSVEELVREISAGKGYIVFTNVSADARVAFVARGSDTNRRSSIVAGAPFWHAALAAVVRLPSLVQAKPPSPPQSRHVAVVLPPDRRGDFDRQVQEERERLESMNDDQRASFLADLAATSKQCRACGGAGCYECMPLEAA